MQRTFSNSVIEKNSTEITKELKSQIKEEEKKKCLMVLEKIRLLNESVGFQNPVDYKRLKLFNYREVIKKPMDLHTIEKNLIRAKYKNFEQFFDDIQLIWTNCKSYNRDDSQIYEFAVKLEKFSKELRHEFFSAIIEKADELNVAFKKKKEKNIFETSRTGINSEDKSSLHSENCISLNDDKNTPNYLDHLSLIEKMSIAEKVKQLDNEGLCQMILFLHNLDKSVIDDFSEEKLHIRLDLLQRENYNKLLKKIESLSSLSTHSSPEEDIYSNSEYFNHDKLSGAVIKNKNKKQKI